MDTTPFHLILLALDVTVLLGLFLWLRLRRNNKTERAAVYQYEKSLYARITHHRPSLRWDVIGVLFFGGFGLVCFAVLSRLIRTGFMQQNVYKFNVGQCIVEGIAVHGTLFFIVAAALLYRNRRHVIALFLSCCALFLAGMSFNMLYWEPYHIKVEHYTIKTSKLSKRLRIVFVADIQTDRVGNHEINTLLKIKQQKADLIIFGGDYLQAFEGTRDKHLPEKFRQLFLDYPLEAPYGVFAIAGNIKDAQVRDAELFNETCVNFVPSTMVYENLGADQGLEPINLVFLGLEDPGFNADGGRSTAALDYALQDEDGKFTDHFVVMAGHYPNYAIDGYKDEKNERPMIGYRNAERAPDLMLAGHTHGGQVAFPFYGPIPWTEDRRIQQIPRLMWSGFFTYPNGGHLLVTRGSGMERGWAPRVRLWCPAEISVINIVPE